MFWSTVNDRVYETVMTTLAVAELMLIPLKIGPLFTAPLTVPRAPAAVGTKLV
jgi:hypothetical protein